MWSQPWTRLSPTVNVSGVNRDSDLVFSDTKGCGGRQTQLIEDVQIAWELHLHNSWPAGSCWPLSLLLFSRLSDRPIPPHLSTQPLGTHWPSEMWWWGISYRSLYKQAWVNIGCCCISFIVQVTWSDAGGRFLVIDFTANLMQQLLSLLI